MSYDQSKKIKVMIVDDQTLFREGLQTVLNLLHDIEVIAVADNGQEALEKVEQHYSELELVLMDVEMPVMNGVESTRLIKERYPHIQVLILSTFAQDKYIVDGLVNGASGYLLKDSRTEDLANHVRQAVKGQTILPGSIAAKLAQRLQQLSKPDPEPSPLPYLGPGLKLPLLDPLTERERDIALLMIKGHTNKEIAEKLFMSDGTIRNNISIIYSKLGTNDRFKAIHWLNEILASDR